jgi:hypothetical protein
MTVTEGTTACWCCGQEHQESELARLRCHEEAALCEGCAEWVASQHRGRRDGAALRRAIPILAVADVRLALEHYGKLGFAVDAHDDSYGYGFVRRGRVELHVAASEGLDPATTTSAVYLHVDDADALFAEWDGAGVAGRLVAPVDTDYGLREGAHVDPDGNLLRFGSPLPED